MEAFDRGRGNLTHLCSIRMSTVNQQTHLGNHLSFQKQILMHEFDNSHFQGYKSLFGCELSSAQDTQ